jgi:hypothetical protein
LVSALVVQAFLLVNNASWPSIAGVLAVVILASPAGQPNMIVAHATLPVSSTNLTQKGLQVKKAWPLIRFAK